MNASAMDILNAYDNTPGLHAVAQAMLRGTGLQGDESHPEPTPGAHPKCGYCGRTSRATAAEICKGCGAPLPEIK